MLQITPQYLSEQELCEDFPQRFWDKVQKRGDDECWPWIASTNLFGYGQIWRGKPFSGLLGGHVASYILNVGPVPPNMCVLHKCIANPGCVNPKHLKLGTKKENARDRENQKRGRHLETHAKGERVASHKLSVFDVRNLRYIRAMYALPYTELARLFKITDVAARLIVLKKSWRHIT